MKTMDKGVNGRDLRNIEEKEGQGDRFRGGSTLSKTRLDGAEIMVGAVVAPFNIILSDNGKVLFHLWSGLGSPLERRKNFMVYV